MKNGLQVDRALLAEAQNLTGIKEETVLLKLGLEALIAKESAMQLLQLEGKGPFFKSVRRRRSSKSK